MKTSLLTLTAAITLFTGIANADSLVKCSTTSKTPTQVLEFSASGLQSRRLVSDVTYINGLNTRSFQSFEVAQYKLTNVDLHVITDDFSGNKSIEATAVGRNSGMLGALVERDSAGTIVRKIAIKCTVTDI